ncbi:MAG: peptide ABC transporter substrate-binding protein [Gammaproteobacteria bacterium]|nr:peptide ABC transporter substrate-binding protein [Gammaproteobacteria bacterium]
MSTTGIESNAMAGKVSSTRSAGRQLALYGGYGVAAIVALMYLLSLAAGSAGGGGSSGLAIDAQNNSITIALSGEPPQMDHTRQVDSLSGTVQEHVLEGLLTYDYSDNLVPGVAYRWEMRDDGATFWLRDNARWSDGEPVTAHDFVFAWRKLVDPDSGSLYSFVAYPIKNAEAVNNGDLPVESLGVRAVDDATLEVEFERPTPYFEKLMAFNTFFPIREDFFNSTNGRYASDADQLLYNGPYVISSWVHGSSMRWEKNPYYWNDEKGFIDVINVGYMTQDVNARLNLFKDGQIVETQLLAPMLTNAMEQRWQIDRFMEGTLFFLEFNHREDRVTRNYHLRKALQLAQDPVEFVYKALKEPSYLPGVSLFPGWIKGVNGLFRQEYPPIKHQINVAKAKEHLALAIQELGLEEIPPIILLVDDSPVGNLTGEYYQAVYRKNLGLDIRIDKQIFKQRLEKMTLGDFDIVAAGWGPDYDDALTYGDLFASWNLNNRGLYSNPEFDQNVRIGQSSMDQQKRMDAFAEIQRIIYEDVVIIPAYERGLSFVVDSRLKNFKRRSIGAPVVFNYAYIDDAEL